MSERTVCVVGSFMMDLAIRAARRPMPGETVVGTSFDMFLGGKGFNQAVAAARAGARTAMVGRLGADEFGRQFLDRLRTESIDGTHVVVDDEVGTGVGLPLVEESGENSIVIVPRANDRLTPSDVGRAAPQIAAAAVLLLQLELPVDTAVAAAEIAKEAGVTVVLNPAPASRQDVLEQFHGLVDVLVPNEIEARALSGAASTSPPAKSAAELSGRLGIPVVATLGPRGCIVASNGSSFEIDGHVVPVVDTVGAGDAFCGVLGAWLSAGAPLHEAVVHANAAGALAVTRAGAEVAMPQRESIVDLAAAPRAAAAADDHEHFITT